MKHIIFILSVAASLLAVGAAKAQETGGALCAKPVTVQGFATCADVKKAEEEGGLVLYSPDVEQGTVKILAAFQAAFPKIKAKYIRLQTGALYAKLMAERQAKSYFPDVVMLSDMSLARNFQGRGGYQRYISPQMSAYESRFKSSPEGFFTWGSVIMAGIAYNPKILSAADAPKDWGDLTDPKWQGAVSVKSGNSGLQYTTWYLLRKIYGKDYWSHFATQKPRAFDSYVQQFDRIVNGEDKVAVTAQYSGYLEFKHKGAPIQFVVPPTGLPTGPQVWGVVNPAPHPQAARLFLDWFLSPAGQKVMANALFMHSARTNAEPPPGGVALSKMKLLIPDDWDVYEKGRRDFVRRWGEIAGMH
jgi:iron(III) transport system substrate-binding protein